MDINLQSPTVEREWIRNEAVAVGTSSVEIAPARNRKMILIRNTSSGTQEITVHLGYGVAVADVGIVLAAGESFSDSSEANYECFSGTITAIGDAASGQLSVVER